MALVGVQADGQHAQRVTEPKKRAQAYNPVLKALTTDALAGCDDVALDLLSSQVTYVRAGWQGLFEEGRDSRDVLRHRWRTQHSTHKEYRGGHDRHGEPEHAAGRRLQAATCQDLTGIARTHAAWLRTIPRRVRQQRPDPNRRGPASKPVACRPVPEPDAACGHGLESHRDGSQCRPTILRTIRADRQRSA